MGGEGGVGREGGVHGVHGVGGDGLDMPTAPRAGRRPVLRWALVAMVAVALAAPLTAGAVLTAWSAGTPDPQARTRGRDAVWLGHAWVDGRRDTADAAALGDSVRGGGVRDFFVHAGPLDDDGGLDPAKHPRARWAVDAVHTAVPGARLQAWLGQRVDPGRLDLHDPHVRARVLDAARRMLDLGFDGVHYNFEPLADGHTGLLDLLDATRDLARPRGAVVSVSAHHVEPLPAAARVDDPLIGHTKWWSPGYLSAVASRVDQVALMSYDTGLPLESLYTGYVRRQTEVALDAVPAGTGLLMGLPAYHDSNWTHRPGAETVAAAVRGVRLGIGSDRRRDFGVAMYADFSADYQDWRSYHSGWVRPAIDDHESQSASISTICTLRYRMRRFLHPNPR